MDEKNLMKADLAKLEKPEEIKQFIEDAKDMGNMDDVIEDARQKMADLEKLSSEVTTEVDITKEAPRVESLDGDPVELTEKTSEVNVEIQNKDKEIEDIKTEMAMEVQNVENEGEEKKEDNAGQKPEQKYWSAKKILEKLEKIKNSPDFGSLVSLIDDYKNATSKYYDLVNTPGKKGTTEAINARHDMRTKDLKVQKFINELTEMKPLDNIDYVSEDGQYADKYRKVTNIEETIIQAQKEIESNPLENRAEVIEEDVESFTVPFGKYPNTIEINSEEDYQKAAEKLKKLGYAWNGDKDLMQGPDFNPPYKLIIEKVSSQAGGRKEKVVTYIRKGTASEY